MKSIYFVTITIILMLSNVMTTATSVIFSCTEVTEIPAKECEALVALFNSTNGPNWSVNTNWLVTNTPSDWWGISLKNGHVSTIGLFSNQLSGPIPASLVDLPSLENLILGLNQLSGSIPPALGSLVNLSYLNLSNNQLTGSIPAELGQLSMLSSLYLHNNQLNGSIPPELGNLGNLYEMYLYNNPISGSIPNELGNIHFLRNLRISNTNLSGPLPGNLAKLSLESFWFNNTSLCEPPDADIQSWMSVIQDLRRTGNLCTKSFVSCTLVTEIPQDECEALVALYDATDDPGWTCDINWKFTDTPGSWYGVSIRNSHVFEIQLPENEVSGTLPSELGDLSGVTKINLLGNHISADIPPEIGNDTSLQYINMGRNQLSGNIPAELGNLTNLLELNLWQNQLTGGIPAQLGNLANLKNLNLSENNLSGIIPPQLANLANLEALDLRYNGLSGGIPLELTNLTNLWLFALGDNPLGGSIPPELGNLVKLRVLVLSNSQLVGSIPKVLGEIPGLAQIFLDGNHLEGSIPIELGELPELWALVLGSNQLIGNIPPTLGGHIRLTFLDLSDNQLSGNIPSSLGMSKNLYFLMLNSNQLSGAIPPELGDLSNLYELWLNDNQLEGDIPETLANLINLADAGMVWSGKDGLNLDYNMLNVPPGYPVPENLWHEFLSHKDPDWQLYQGFKLIIGSSGGEIKSLDGKTYFTIPAGVVEDDTTFTFMPLPSPTYAYGALEFANNSFRLSGVDATGNPVITFNIPVTVTISYTHTDILNVSEDSLRLEYWKEESNRWSDTVTTCPLGEYSRDLEGNTLSLEVCHLTEFGLFGGGAYFFLPVITR